MGNFSKNISGWASFSGKKGPGLCAICGEHGKLTKDHVPPKSCVPMQPAVLSRIAEESYGDARHEKGPVIQGGLRFKTICSTCNNYRLGQLYDVELLRFVNGFQSQLQVSGITTRIPPIIQVKANLHSVARAVVGHLLAAHSVRDTEQRSLHAQTDPLRAYFLNPESPFPEKWKLFCWPYFDRRQVIFRHMVWAKVLQSKEPMYGHLLKFTPFAFWLVENPHSSFDFVIQDITPNSNDPGQISSVYFPMYNVPHRKYPESPTDSMIILGAPEQTSVARPYSR